MSMTRGAYVSLVVALAAGACGDSVGPGGSAHVRVLLTDAAVDYAQSAMMDIGAVELVPAGEGGPVTLSEDGTDGPVDLLELQDAATELLADAEIEAGAYAQLRLIVESASVVLKDGYEFSDQTTERALTVPSGAETGIKLLLRDEDGVLDIPEGDLVLVVDFDVSRSFVALGNPDTPAGLDGILFKPTLRVVVEDVAGSISGSVSTELADTEVEELTVTATPVDEGLLEEHQTETATTMTGEEGAYTLHFLVPGSYWVKVTPPGGLVAEPDSTLVEVDLSEDVADVDFELVAGS